MLTIRDPQLIADKWSRVVQGRGKDYEDGINNPRADWMTATLAAEANHTAGVQAAIASKAFARGVRAAGTAAWQFGATQKGPARWQQGIALSTGKYAANFAKYGRAIAGLTLPPRGPAGDPRNIQRVAIVADALHKLKVSG